ncbi:hypothetical protein RchiOBHm_Chr5g0030501 [Rosa chinensis]|uniref:Uncharacterized protein n=1 Tax=Rosa chinensis TaxID=74649 RepID=A0A2P6Q9Y7_ROSCH|nr:hypothetical protein RchiOBHm_Chr5g0030501 [Rosa chinensis]
MYNLVHPVISGMITIFTSGFRRKMIWNFVGLFGFFRGKEGYRRSWTRRAGEDP